MTETSPNDTPLKKTHPPSELGAQQWAHGIREHQQIAAGVKYQYEDPADVPPCSATVVLNGQPVVEHRSAELDATSGTTTRLKRSKRHSRFVSGPYDLQHHVSPGRGDT